MSTNKMFVCPIDSRKFTTKQGLAQHRRDSHTPKVAVRTARKSVPRKMPVVASDGHSDIPLRFKRMEYVTSVTVAKKQANSGGYAEFYPNSASFPTLRKFANIYECYKLHSATVSYKSSSSAMQDGQVILAVDYNKKSAVGISKQTLLGLVNLVTPVWQNVSGLKVRCTSSTVRYTQRTDEGRDTPFLVYWYCDRANATEVDIIAGDVYVSYDIEFFGLKA